MGNLIKAAESFGFDCQASVYDYGMLAGLRFPIVYLDGPPLGRSFLMHAVVVAKQSDRVTVLDPSQGVIDLAEQLFKDAWEAAGSYAVSVQLRQP